MDSNKKITVKLSRKVDLKGVYTEEIFIKINTIFKGQNTLHD